MRCNCNFASGLLYMRCNECKICRQQLFITFLKKTSCEKFFFKYSFWKCEKMISPQQGAFLKLICYKGHTSSYFEYHGFLDDLEVDFARADQQFVTTTTNSASVIFARILRHCDREVKILNFDHIMLQFLLFSWVNFKIFNFCWCNTFEKLHVSKE